MLVPVLTILIAVSIIFYFYSKGILINESREKNLEKVNAVVNELEGYLKEKAKIAWTFCQEPMILDWLHRNEERDPDRTVNEEYNRIISYLQQLVQKDGKIETLYLSSEKTRNYYDSTDVKLDADYQVNKRPWYINALQQGGPSWDMDVDYLSKEIRVNYRYPIFDPDGTLVGIGGMDILFEKFKTFMESLGNTIETGQVILLGKDNTILLHPDERLVLKKKITDFEDDGTQFRGVKKITEKILSGEEGFERVVFNGEDRCWIFKPVKTLGWTLVLSVSAGVVNRPLAYLTTTSVIIILAALGVLLVFILLITRSLSTPVCRLVEMIKDIARGKGDLTKRLDIESKDEFGELARWFNQFIDQLQGIVASVQDNAVAMLGSAQKIALDSENLAIRSHEQNSAIKETAATLDTFTGILKQNNESAANASTTINTFNREVQSKKSLIENVTITMKTIDDSGGKIAAIVNVINDISFQTNLLALNAAVEAARAGEAGRGFAVVAAEVRNLAQKTADSSKTISAIVGENIDSVKKGMQLVGETARFFDSMIGTLKELVKNIENISTGSREQATGVEKINDSISHLQNVVSRNLTLVQEFAENGRNLNSNASELEKLVEQFNVR